MNLTSSNIPPINKSARRIQGLDSIRFTCAFIVMLGHLWHDRSVSSSGIYHVLLRISEVLFNGPAAVIVFFVISGFCIHFPFTRDHSINIPSFYFRRLIRISIPSLIAAGIWSLLSPHKIDWSNTVLWSIFCEIIYYLIYPTLLIARMRSGWIRLIVISYIVATILTISNVVRLHHSYNEYTTLGMWTWVLGLPCWLLGCYLAEEYSRFPRLAKPSIWLVRSLVVLISIGLRVLKFHSTSLLASNCITLNIFAVVIFFWLGLEVMYFSTHNAFSPLEWAGGWSYSLYLMHPAAGDFLAFCHLDKLTIRWELKNALLIATALIISYCFHLAAERPSHKLAVYVSKNVKFKGRPVSINFDKEERIA